MKHLYTLPILLAVVFFCDLSLADVDDESLLNYDEIVSELSQTRSTRTRYSADPFANIAIHGGVAYVTSFISVRQDNGSLAGGFLNGFEANFGIDLFSRYWQAEGAVRSFSEEKIKEDRASLKEFDLKLIYKPYVSRSLKIRTGFGLAARYLNYYNYQPDAAGGPGKTTFGKYTTPSSVFLLGGEAVLSKGFSVGVEVAYRRSMIEETIDDNSVDASLKLNTHF